MEASALTKAFESNRPFAVPVRLVKPHLADIQSMLGRNILPRPFNILHPEIPVEVDAYLLPGRVHDRSCREQLFGQNGILSDVSSFELFEARTSDRIVPIMIPAEHRLVVHDIENIHKMDRRKNAALADTVSQPRVLAWTFYEQDLILLSRLTGYQIDFEPFQIGLNEHPSNETDSLGISISIQTGDVSMRYGQVVFGHRITEKGEWKELFNPTRGRGFIIQDPAGEAVAQIIDRNAYILIPIFSTFHEYGSRAIFQKLLVAIWQAWRDIQSKKRTPHKESHGRQAFIDHMTPRLSLSLDVWKDLLEEKQKAITETRERLASLYRQEMEYRRNVDYFSQPEHIQKQQEGLHLDFSAIRRNPLTRRVYVCDGGVHIETNTVHIEHEGKTYEIGRFVVRFGAHCEVVIWPLEAKHPLQTPHPHLKNGHPPCFGTASDAIAKACGQLRLADAYDLIAQWITSYTPANMSTPIEEWSRPEDTEEFKALLRQIKPPKRSTEEADDVK